MPRGDTELLRQLQELQAVRDGVASYLHRTAEALQGLQEFGLGLQNKLDSLLQSFEQHLSLQPMSDGPLAVGHVNQHSSPSTEHQQQLQQAQTSVGEHVSAGGEGPVSDVPEFFRAQEPDFATPASSPTPTKSAAAAAAQSRGRRKAAAPKRYGDEATQLADERAPEARVAVNGLAEEQIADPLTAAGPSAHIFAAASNHAKALALLDLANAGSAHDEDQGEDAAAGPGVEQFIHVRRAGGHVVQVDGNTANCCTDQQHLACRDFMSSQELVRARHRDLLKVFLQPVSDDHALRNERFAKPVPHMEPGAVSALPLNDEFPVFGGPTGAEFLNEADEANKAAADVDAEVDDDFEDSDDGEVTNSDDESISDDTRELGSDSDVHVPQSMVQKKRCVHQQEDLMSRILGAGSPSGQPPSVIAALVQGILPQGGSNGELGSLFSRIAAAARSAATSRILAVVAAAVEEAAEAWRDEHLAELEADAVQLWHKRHDRETWQGDLTHYEARLADLVQQLVVTHADDVDSFERDKHRHMKALTQTVEDIQLRTAYLRIADLSEAPVALQQAAQQKLAAAAAVTCADRHAACVSNKAVDEQAANLVAAALGNQPGASADVATVAVAGVAAIAGVVVDRTGSCTLSEALDEVNDDVHSKSNDCSIWDSFIDDTGAPTVPEHKQQRHDSDASERGSAPMDVDSEGSADVMEAAPKKSIKHKGKTHVLVAGSSQRMAMISSLLASCQAGAPASVNGLCPGPVDIAAAAAAAGAGAAAAAAAVVIAAATVDSNEAISASAVMADVLHSGTISTVTPLQPPQSEGLPQRSDSLPDTPTPVRTPQVPQNSHCGLLHALPAASTSPLAEDAEMNDCVSSHLPNGQPMHFVPTQVQEDVLSTEGSAADVAAVGVTTGMLVVTHAAEVHAEGVAANSEIAAGATTSEQPGSPPPAVTTAAPAAPMHTAAHVTALSNSASGMSLSAASPTVSQGESDVEVVDALPASVVVVSAWPHIHPSLPAQEGKQEHLLECITARTGNCRWKLWAPPKVTPTPPQCVTRPVPPSSPALVKAQLQPYHFLEVFSEEDGCWQPVIIISCWRRPRLSWHFQRMSGVPFVAKTAEIAVRCQAAQSVCSQVEDLPELLVCRLRPLRGERRDQAILVVKAEAIRSGGVRPLLQWDSSTGEWSLVQRDSKLSTGPRLTAARFLAAFHKRIVWSRDQALQATVAGASAMDNPGGAAAMLRAATLAQALARRPFTDMTGIAIPAQSKRRLHRFAARRKPGGTPIGSKQTARQSTRIITRAAATDKKRRQSASSSQIAKSQPGSVGAAQQIPGAALDSTVCTGPLKKKAHMADPLESGVKMTAAAKARLAKEQQSDTAVQEMAAKAKAAAAEKRSAAHRARLLGMESQPDELALAEGAVPLFADPPRPTPLLAGCFDRVLKEHQRRGVRFMWRNIVDEWTAARVNDEEAEQGGCILAHSMGLGKTLTTIAFLHTFFAAAAAAAATAAAASAAATIGGGGLGGVAAATASAGVGRALLVVPKNILLNFAAEFAQWLPKEGTADAATSPLKRSKVHIHDSRLHEIETWYSQEGSVLLITPHKLQRLLDPAVKTEASETVQSAECRAKVRTMLLEGPTVVVMDEAHELKNPSSKICAAMKRIHTQRRVALTGYPLQNNLDEYYVMLTWVRGALLGTPMEFKMEFADIVKAGQDRSADAIKKRRSWQRLAVLEDITSDFMDRAGPELLTQELPAKTEHVLHLRLTPFQEELYLAYLQALINHGERKSLFRDFEILNKLLNVPEAFIDVMEKGATNPELATRELATQLEGEDYELSITPSQKYRHQSDAHCTPAVPGTSAAAEMAAAASSAAAGMGDGQSTPPRQTQLPSQLTQRQGKKGKGAKQEVQTIALKQEVCQQVFELVKAKRAQLATPGNSTTSEALFGELPKHAVLKGLLRHCKACNEKLVIFTQSVKVLQSIQGLLQHDLGYVAKKQFYVYDGSTSAENRKEAITAFNDKPEARVMLLTTKAGGMGVNLVSAFRMCIVDVGWNPVWNAQAVARIYRFGQRKPTFVYRLLYANTSETYIYKDNIKKEELFSKVVDKKPVQNSTEAQGNYTYEPPPQHVLGLSEMLQAAGNEDPAVRTLSIVPGFANWMAAYHTHASMLSGDPEGVMTPADRKQASRAFVKEVVAPRMSTQGATDKGLQRRRNMLKRKSVQWGDKSDDDDWTPPGEHQLSEEPATQPVPAPAAMQQTSQRQHHRNAAKHTVAAADQAVQHLQHAQRQKLSPTAKTETAAKQESQQQQQQQQGVRQPPSRSQGLHKMQTVVDSGSKSQPATQRHPVQQPTGTLYVTASGTVQMQPPVQPVHQQSTSQQQRSAYKQAAEAAQPQQTRPPPCPVPQPQTRTLQQQQGARPPGTPLSVKAQRALVHMWAGRAPQSSATQQAAPAGNACRGESDKGDGSMMKPAHGSVTGKTHAQHAVPSLRPNATAPATAAVLADPAGAQLAGASAVDSGHHSHARQIPSEQQPSHHRSAALSKAVPGAQVAAILPPTQCPSKAISSGVQELLESPVLQHWAHQTSQHSTEQRVGSMLSLLSAVENVELRRQVDLLTVDAKQELITCLLQAQWLSAQQQRPPQAGTGVAALGSSSTAAPAGALPAPLSRSASLSTSQGAPISKPASLHTSQSAPASQAATARPQPSMEHTRPQLTAIGTLLASQARGPARPDSSRQSVCARNVTAALKKVAELGGGAVRKSTVGSAVKKSTVDRCVRAARISRTSSAFLVASPGHRPELAKAFDVGVAGKHLTLSAGTSGAKELPTREQTFEANIDHGSLQPAAQPVTRLHFLTPANHNERTALVQPAPASAGVQSLPTAATHFMQPAAHSLHPDAVRTARTAAQASSESNLHRPTAEAAHKSKSAVRPTGSVALTDCAQPAEGPAVAPSVALSEAVATRTPLLDQPKHGLLPAATAVTLAVHNASQPSLQPDSASKPSSTLKRRIETPAGDRKKAKIQIDRKLVISLLTDSESDG